MKKLMSLVLIALVILTGCSVKDSDGASSSKTPMPEIIDTLCVDLRCKGVDVPAYEATELTKENFEYFTFIPYTDGLTGYQADALINATPHSLVLIRSENGDTADLAQKMLDNADPHKWINVSAEAVQTAYTEHYVILAMSSEVIVESIITNFKTAVNDGEATKLDVIVISDESTAD